MEGSSWGRDGQGDGRTAEGHWAREEWPKGQRRDLAQRVVGDGHWQSGGLTLNWGWEGATGGF